MINQTHLLKVSMIWVSIVYAICYLGVLLFPGIRPGFMLYALHTELNIGTDVLTITTFVTGLIIWNIIAIIAVWLFAYLFNKIKT